MAPLSIFRACENDTDKQTNGLALANDVLIVSGASGVPSGPFQPFLLPLSIWTHSGFIFSLVF
jgi:hypothetical protein